VNRRTRFSTVMVHVIIVSAFLPIAGHVKYLDGILGAVDGNDPRASNEAK